MKFLRTILFLLTLLLAPAEICMTARPAPPIDGNENWDQRFGIPGVNGEVRAIAVSGDDIYIGGTFTRAGNIYVNNIARWSSSSHKRFPRGQGRDGVSGTVLAIAISGDRVYVGGQLTGGGLVSSQGIVAY